MRAHLARFRQVIIESRFRAGEKIKVSEFKKNHRPGRPRRYQRRSLACQRRVPVNALLQKG
jgi:hypothetical protein